MSNNRDQVSAVESSDQVLLKLEPTVCDQCEGECWSAEVEARGTINTGHWATSLLYVDHTQLSSALLATSRTFGRIGGQARQREHRAWFLEHQLRML